MNAFQLQDSFEIPVRAMQDLNWAAEIIAKKIDDLKVEQATIKVFGPDLKWRAVKESWDSCATVTTGSVQAHDGFCDDNEMIRKHWGVVLP